MKVIWAIAILAWPIGASAELLFVDYSGVVSFVTGRACECTPYHVGDRISGQLVIDTDLAPANSAPPGNKFGSYGNEVTASADFVRGFNPNSAESNDAVFVRNGLTLDFYRVSDLRRSGDTVAGLTLSVGSTPDLLTNVDIVQNLLVTPEDEPSAFHGVVYWSKGLVQRTAGFVLDRFKVTPGRCMPS